MKVCGFLLMGILFFIWPVGAISVRDISILLLFFIFGYTACRTRPLLPHRTDFTTKELAAPFVILAILTAWIILEAVFISKETAWSLKEIWGQWLMSLVVFITAALAGLSTVTTGVTGARKEGAFFNGRNIIMLLFCILLFHILYVDLYSIYTYAKTAVLPSRVAGLTPGMDKSSYLSHFLLTILCVEIYFRARHRKEYLRVNNSILFLSLPLTFFSIYLEAVRNGTVTAVLLVFAFTILYFSKSGFSFKKTALLSFVVVLMLFFSYVSFKSDQRWKTFIETLPLALDTQNNRGWLDHDKYPYPKLKSGETVHGSNFERIAWFKEGVILVRENPLGVGFGRSVFGHALKRKYGDDATRVTHSHSGIVDFAIGTGLPGFLLWILFIINLMYVSIRKFRDQNSYCALLLFFIAADFTLRSVVDSIIRDHMLEMFMFFAGLLYVLMLKEKEAYEASPAENKERAM